MFEKLLKKIATSLFNHNIPYIIIGGQAVLLYGEPRLTRDIDITLGLNTDKLKILLPILDEIGVSPLIKDINEFIKETMVLPTQEPKSGIRVDFIFSFIPYERQAIRNANEIKIGSTRVCFASLEDTIIHKIFAGRPRDIEDVKGILLKNPNPNTGYIKKWLKEFDKGLEGDFLRTFEALIREYLK